MTDDAVGRLHIAELGNPVVAFSAVTVTCTGVEIGRCVALLTGVSVMKKYLGGCCGGWSTTTLNVTGKAFSRIERIVILN